MDNGAEGDVAAEHGRVQQFFSSKVQMLDLDRLRPSGFTLIELMIVVIILAILVTIALPSYFEQVRKSRRADAEAALMFRAQLLERCFTRTQTYDDSGCPDPAGASEKGFYAITVERTSATWTLTAAPQGPQANDVCGNFTLDHLGNKTPLADHRQCWGAR